LAIRDRIAARRAAKSVGSGAVTIWCAAAVLRIVLPVAPAGRQRGRAIPATYTADAANSPGSSDSTDPSRFPSTSYPACSTDSPNSSGATDSADATRPSNSANTTSTADSTNPTGSSNSTDATSPTEIATIPTPRYWIRGAIAAADVVAVAAVNVRISVEVVVVVDIDVVVAAPSATPSPTAAPKRAHHDANTKGDCHACGVVSRWRIVDRRVRINGRAVHHDRIIRGHVHDLRIRLLDDDYALIFDDLRFYFLLLIRFQIALILCLLAHALDRIHHILLLSQERIA
jgi:hypothetical protein